MKFNYLLFLSLISLYITSTLAGCHSRWVEDSCRKYFDEYYGDNKCSVRGRTVKVTYVTPSVCSNYDCYKAFHKGLLKADKCKLNGIHTNDKNFKKCKKALKKEMDKYYCHRS
ncbi:hypothetical protein PIROE2DRAFT_1736 [Piromyces sp. E2]|nr:hypothetical protein PIROE2DRAFT_1736 [Piromyces sp. E2]|eukprot:OUM70062.1 hypothetical protein PIROE2DRAFT_1736 [Piromyces sp. E2]